MGHFLVWGCPQRGEISSCLYERNIADEIKFVIFKSHSVVSALFNGIPGFCGVAFGAARARGWGEVSRGEDLERSTRFLLHFDQNSSVLFCTIRVHVGGLQILPLLLIACVSFNKFLKLSVPQFSFLKK